MGEALPCARPANLQTGMGGYNNRYLVPFDQNICKVSRTPTNAGRTAGDWGNSCVIHPKYIVQDGLTIAASEVLTDHCQHVARPHDAAPGTLLGMVQERRLNYSLTGNMTSLDGRKGWAIKTNIVPCSLISRQWRDPKDLLYSGITPM